MSVKYAPTNIRIPRGFQNILEALAREVLREQPEDLLKFSSEFFKEKIRVRDGKIFGSIFASIFWQ